MLETLLNMYIYIILLKYSCQNTYHFDPPVRKRFNRQHFAHFQVSRIDVAVIQ